MSVTQPVLVVFTWSVEPAQSNEPSIAEAVFIWMCKSIIVSVEIWIHKQSPAACIQIFRRVQCFFLLDWLLFYEEMDSYLSKGISTQMNVMNSTGI